MSIKKVCIVTNYSRTLNYGALLQAYALNYVINSMGHSAENLYYIQDITDKTGSVLGQIGSGNIKSVINRIKGRFEKIIIRKQLDTRKAVMDKFRFSIPHTPRYNNEGIGVLSEKYDIFICGSDQIFRPNKYSGELEKHYWLTMADDSCIKASYAASMGVEKYNPAVEKTAVEYLSSFNYISMREENATAYIREITGRDDVVTCIDPVFLLDRDKWEDLERPYHIDEKYILVYMIYGSEELFTTIKEFARLTGLKILTFPSMASRRKPHETGFADIEVYDADPFQFISLIHQAEYIFTDSFHCTAFSLILHKQAFVSNANEKLFSRIENLLNFTHCADMKIPSEGLKPEKYYKKPKIDWDIADHEIETRKRSSLEYLQKILES